MCHSRLADILNRSWWLSMRWGWEILSNLSVSSVSCHRLPGSDASHSPCHSVFHAALIVMAALQVHQTHTALVSLGGCPASVDFVVCTPTMICQVPEDNLQTEMRWTRNIMASNWTIPNRCSMRARWLIADPHVLDQGAVRWIWVRAVALGANLNYDIVSQMGDIPRRWRQPKDEEWAPSFSTPDSCLTVV